VPFATHTLVRRVAGRVDVPPNPPHDDAQCTVTDRKQPPSYVRHGKSSVHAVLPPRPEGVMTPRQKADVSCNECAHSRRATIDTNNKRRHPRFGGKVCADVQTGRNIDPAGVTHVGIVVVSQLFNFLRKFTH
jgi:hypothetical protein